MFTEITTISSNEGEFENYNQGKHMKHFTLIVCGGELDVLVWGINNTFVNVLHEVVHSAPN